METKDQWDLTVKDLDIKGGIDTVVSMPGAESYEANIFHMMKMMYSFDSRNLSNGPEDVRFFRYNGRPIETDQDIFILRDLYKTTKSIRLTVSSYDFCVGCWKALATSRCTQCHTKYCSRCDDL